MLELDNIKAELPKLKDELSELASSLNEERLEARLDEINTEIGIEGFWDDPEAAQKVIQEKGALEKKVGSFKRLSGILDDAEMLIALAEDAGEGSEDEAQAAEEVISSIAEFKSEVESLTLETLLNGEYDKNNAILSIHPGTGGVEAQDWAEMLLRMYTRWADKHGYKLQMIDLQPDDEAGIKGAEMLIEGENAYGYLKSEHGVHRLVRISPFNAQGKRQTSFTLVEVAPELSDEVEVDIDEKDLRIDTYRSSGAGGQHVNKTDSAIRITHLPTGIVVTCQNERSQIQNKAQAMKVLRSKLMQLAREQQKQDLRDIKGDAVQGSWGNQIRNYVFQPYTLVKDTRTGAEVGNIQAVMDGDLDFFMNEYLKFKAAPEAGK